MPAMDRLRSLLWRVPGLRKSAQVAKRLAKGGRLYWGAVPPGVYPFLTYYEPGHYYSPLPTLEDVERHADVLFAPATELPGVDLRPERQLALLDEIAGHYDDMPFSDVPTPDLRYHFGNLLFEQADAIMLYAMLRHFTPKRVIEVGCGYSSAVMLDTNERFLDRRIDFTFIDPYPQRLHSLLRPEDERHCEVIPSIVQDVSLERFDALEQDDVLFIDSSHVSRIGSDVNHLFFRVLPRLAPGVLVHVHDIFWPLEYPRNWIREGRGWNENYLVRAFLMYNGGFEVLAFNSYLGEVHRESVERLMPRFLENTGGSLWLRKLT